jgi:hypothetical protein
VPVAVLVVRFSFAELYNMHHVQAHTNTAHPPDLELYNFLV